MLFTFTRFFWLILTILVSSVSTFAQDPHDITKQMFAVVNKTKTLQYTLESLERVNGKLKKEIMFFKISTDPVKAYVFQYYPKNGIQMLYVDNKNGGKAKLNPGGFPWVSLNLDPEGELMLENRHHSIFDAGFNYTTSVLEYLLDKYSSQTVNLMKLNDIETIHGIECYSITFTNPNYRHILYTAKNGDTPLSIARKLHINFYSVMENNDGLKPNTKIKEGTKLIVPNDYASKMELYINKNLMYPVFLQIYDQKGLYEEFLFRYVKINPPFKEIDFSEMNPAYKF